MPRPLVFRLSKDDRTTLRTLVRTGHTNARTFARVFALLKADEGWSVVQICEAFDISRNTVLTVRRAYMARGLGAVLHDKKQKRQRQALTIRLICCHSFARVIWTRGRHPGAVDVTLHIRAYFTSHEFPEVAFIPPENETFSAGVNRFAGTPQQLLPGEKMFTFIQ